jgi:hypothetical protein
MPPFSGGVIMPTAFKRAGHSSSELYRTARNLKAIAKAKQYRRGSVPDLVRRLLDRCTQRTVQFIRWVRNNLDRQAPWQSILEPLRRRYAINQE